jgi:hypothetical protein
MPLDASIFWRGINSPPPLVCTALMVREKKFSTRSLNLWKIVVTSDLQDKVKTHIYLLKSSTMQRKYFLLLDDKVGAGPRTSRKRRSKGSLETEGEEPKCNL